ncbi:type II restriction endonuclease [Streptococcus intermedius]|uniref:type II restriction endonuclease n=1 Tax=Streptococcus intermedius TaxID=1338 RepID=UPI000E3C8EFB|nr:type II restriction endonuclease [Streptococcus intermedius]
MNFQEYITSSPEERLNHFLNTLSVTNRTPEYYVNWEKVSRKTKKFELELNTLNYLIGKEDIYNVALVLFQKQPDLLKAVPSLIASRDKILDILVMDNDDNMSFERLDFKKIDTNRLVEYLDFIEQSGLLDFLQNHANRSLVDYVYGVESGLDSNARKNRSGTTMEGILERNVAKVCQTYGLEYKAQATPAFIKENWRIVVPVDKSERRFDVAVFSSEKKKCWLIETNYYGGGGSKLKAVAGEFTELSQFVETSDDDVTFIWVTDGQGWKTAHLPLAEAFAHIPNVFNLEMLKQDYLVELLK